MSRQAMPVKIVSRTFLYARLRVLRDTCDETGIASDTSSEPLGKKSAGRYER